MQKSQGVKTLRTVVVTDNDLEAGAADGPDVTALWRHLSTHGISGHRWPAGKWPWNPFGRGPMALRGLDPLRTVRIWLTQYRYDLIMCVFEASAVGLCLLKALGVLRKPIVLWDFGTGTTWRLRKLFQYVVFRWTDSVFCLTSSQINALENRFKAHSKARYIGYEVDTQFFDHSLSCEGSYILSVGKDISRDYDTLIKSVQNLPVILKIVTNLPLLVPNNTVAQIEKIDRYVSYQELRDLYAHARFVVLPLKDMPHPGGITTLVEAMSMGKAVICSNSSGIADLLVSGSNAVVVPPGNVDALSTAIINLNKDAKKRKFLGKNSHKFVNSRCSTMIFSKRFEILLREVLAKS